MLHVRNLSKRFGPQAVVHDVSLDLAAGEILALIGPSGCGKTTTLRMIAGFETPDAGAIHLSGRDVTALPPEKRGIGMVFQDYALFPHMTVAENVRFGARDGQGVEHYLGVVGLSGFGSRYPDELSGGQQQRVALARSLAAQPGIILLDEPFSNLDPILRSGTRREIRRMLKSQGLGIIVVTHDQEEALSFADRIAVMDQGRLVQSGTATEVYDNPVSAFVAGFLGRTNLIHGTATGDLCDTPLGPLRLARPQASGPVTLSLRPEHIALRPDAGGDGQVLSVEFKGHDVTYWVAWQGMELQVDTLTGMRVAEGDRVTVEVRGKAVPLTAGV